MSDLTEKYRLSCYQKIKPLDENDTIWLVSDSVTGRQCVMRRQPMSQRKVYQRLLTLRHPHIVEILDVIPYAGVLYVIEEYLSGNLLSLVLSGEKLSRRAVLKMGDQLLQALNALHQSQIIHRDVKPENVMVDVEGNCKLIDFDIARIYLHEKKRDTSMKGTRDYAPPEQFGFGQTDERADIYAFGVVLNVMVTGCFPTQKLCGGQLGGIVRRCVEFDPARRFHNVRQIQKCIRLLQWEKLACLVSVLFILCIILGLKIISQNRISTFEEMTNAGRSDRIVRLGGGMAAGELPALLLEDQEKIIFSTDQISKSDATVCVEKTNDSLQISITAKDRQRTEFSFEDIVKGDKVLEWAYDVDLEETSSEYEILLHDMDQNGTEDIVISLARRKQVSATGHGDSFYLTAYTILWVVYWDEGDTFGCSEPLIFSEMPVLTADGVLQDEGRMEWIGLENGIWKLY